MTANDLKKHGGTAFPTCVSINSNDEVCEGTSGMSLRDWLAGQALAGMSGTRARDGDHFPPSVLAESSYALADAMLAARKERR